MNTDNLSPEFREILPAFNSGNQAAAKVIDLLHVEGALNQADYAVIRKNLSGLIAEGDPLGLVCLGHTYARGPEKNPEIAENYYLRAAKKGDPQGMRFYVAGRMIKYNQLARERSKRSVFIKTIDWLLGRESKLKAEIEQGLMELFILLKASALSGDEISREVMAGMEEVLFKHATAEEMDFLDKKAEEFLASAY